MKILVTGAAGLLGSEVVASAAARGHEVLGLVRSDLDVTDGPEVMDVISRAGPDWVVHCAAYTNVDGAEADEERALAVNRDGTAHAAAAATASGGRFCCISTDYVFDGRSSTPYAPDDPTRPLSAYGRSKLAAEEAARALAPDALVARVGWLFGSARRNFVTAMIERASAGEPLTVVEDQVGRPSWSAHVAEALVELVELGETGVWHVANGGTASWLDLARESLRLAGIEAPVEGIAAEAWNAPAERPAYSVLDLAKTEQRLGRRLWPWRDALALFISRHLQEGHAT